MRNAETNGRSGPHPADDVKMIRAIRDREKLAPGFPGGRDNGFVAVERGENQFERFGSGESRAVGKVLSHVRHRALRSLAGGEIMR